MGYTPPQLEVRKITGGWAAYGLGATTDDLTIYANTTDTTPYVKLNGASTIILAHPSGQEIDIFDGATIYMVFSYSTPDCIIKAPADKNIFLKYQGTGKLKLNSTATATGDVACNGHFDILDSAGSTVKLMTCA